jgi:putative spermidine/putrescine transport system substrate-binding protein
MTVYGLNRRGFVGGLAAGTALATRTAQAAAPPLPKSPVALSIIDVGGALALLQQGFDAYRAARPELVSKITFVKAPAPELAGKIKAQQDAGRSDLDLVLTSSDALSAGLELGLWAKIFPDFQDAFPNIEANYEPTALKLFKQQGQGYGVVCAYYPSGPILEYAPERVKDVPKTAAELLSWAKAHPNKFMYARPANSGPGKSFIMGLPYLLGDKDPQDPVNGWDKSWAYMRELSTAIEYYPTGTGVTMKEFGEGTRDIIVSTTGWDINPRYLGIVPKSAAIGTLQGFHWVADAFFMTVPKGVPQDRFGVLLDMMAFILTPKIQAFTYDDGYLYPGPAVKDVPLSLAPQKSQDVIAEFGRPEYAKLIADNPIELSLPPDKLVLAFRRWDEEIGSKKGK